MKVKRRKKSTRYRGSRMNRRGYKNRTKGSGNRGGYGKAGTGKRGDQRKSLVINMFGNEYFKKDRSTSKKSAIPSISLRTLEEQLSSLMKKNIVKESGGFYEVNLPEHKVVGNLTNLKFKIHARKASENAKKAVSKAGGEISVEDKNAN